MYTYKNLALAHQSAVPKEEHRKQKNYAMIRCRMVARPCEGEGGASASTIVCENLVAEKAFLKLDTLQGALDDSGVAFCSQPLPIIPTHLIIYQIKRGPDQVQMPANADGALRTAGKVRS